MRSLFLFVILLAMTGETQAFDDESILKVKGDVHLVKADLPGSINIEGDFRGERVKLGHTEIKGNVELIDSEITVRAAFEGDDVYIENSNLTENLELTTKRVILNHSTFNTLLIFPVEGYDGEQLLELRNGTNIKGSIVFYSGKGRVIRSKDSLIRSEIIGAEVE